MLNTIHFVLLPILTLSLLVPAAAQDQLRQDEVYGILDLTEEQFAAIQEQRLAFQKEILSLQTKLQTAYMELDNLYLQNAEQDKIDAQTAELDRMELELDKRFEVHQQQIRGLLTDEQKVLFDRFGALGMGPDFGMGYGVGLGRGYGAAYGRGYGAGYGRGAWGRGRAWNPDARYRGGYTRYRGYGRPAARGYGRDLGYTRAPARGLGRAMARTGAAYRIRRPMSARDAGRYVGRWFPRCWRWR
jgi:hypothetical protein